MHAVMSRAFQQISCSSYCLKDMKFQKGTKSNVRVFKVLFHLFYVFKHYVDWIEHKLNE